MNERETRPSAKVDVGGPVGALVLHVGTLRLDTTGTVGTTAHVVLEGYSTRSDVPRKLSSGRANKGITGIGVWKHPTRDHLLRLRGAAGEAKDRPPAEEEVGPEVGED